ncbi:CPBP family intramembrane glutamic endopeptidase [Novosphingobium terrae]|uniref:CPBP family intramembrane glutamic endopeptidase n=1 Tax=Novosphingobium terrae TaxID=2726189 RepID=UPI00197E4755|nr:type II CAAX endopeptidase family protein [Novosphingobium terrae]
MRAELLGTAWNRQSRIILGNKGVLRPGPWMVLRSLLWMIALLIVTGAILSLQSLVTSLIPHATVTVAMAFICTGLGFTAYIALVRQGEKRWPVELSTVGFLREYLAGFLTGGLIIAMTIGFLWLAGGYEIKPGRWTDWPHDLREAIGTGLLEELLARLIIFRLLSRAFGMAAGLLLSAAAFGAAHLSNPHATPLAALAIAVEAGLLFAGFYMLTGRIWMSAGIHAGWNLMLGGIFGARVSGMASDGSLLVSLPRHGSIDALTGGGFGPEASLPAVILGLGAFALIVRFLPKCRQPPKSD